LIDKNPQIFGEEERNIKPGDRRRKTGERNKENNVGFT